MFEFVDGVRVSRDEISNEEISELYWANFKLKAGWDAYLRAAIGCKRAHMKCLERGHRANLSSLLICEDDMAFRNNWRPVLERALNDLPSGWLQLYFSAWSFRPSIAVTPTLKRLQAACQLTAVLYSKEGIEAALKCVKHARSEIDWWMGLHLHPFGCSYVVEPGITYQTGGFSDCQGTWRGETP
jgi:hypothetical protein